MKKQLNIKIDGDLLDRLHRIVYYRPEYTMTSFCEQAIEIWVRSAEELYPHIKKDIVKLHPGRKISRV